MRIVTPHGFHDYYDGLMSTDLDRSLTYVREPKEVPLQAYPFPFFSYWGDRSYNTGLNITNYTTGFCGHLYPCLHLQKENKVRFCYTAAEVTEFIRQNCKKRLVEDYQAENFRWGRNHWPHDARQILIERFFDEFPRRVQEMNQDNIKKHFKDCPLFIGQIEADYKHGRSAIITYNARLKDVEFFRIFNSYQAYQEIRMYLGNIAAPETNIPYVDDQTLLEAKGFDPKFSFRKPSSKKK